MISLIGKWMYAENEDGNPGQECFVAESEESDWLLVDVELTSDEAAFLKDYIVVPVLPQSQVCVKPFSIQAAPKDVGKKNIEKCQKYFYGKMISRRFSRKRVQPFTIERPLRYKAPPGYMREMEPLQQLHCWLEMMSIKIPRPFGKPGNTPAARVNVKSLKSPVLQEIHLKSCKQAIKANKLQLKHVFVEDLNTCKSLVQFESSPVIKLLQDLDNITRERTFEFVAGIGKERQLPLRMILRHDHVYNLIQMSIRKRRKFNSAFKVTTELPSPEPSVVSSEPMCNPKPLLALEWQPEEPEEWPAGFEALLEDEEEEEERWFAKPAMSLISDICEMTSKLGHGVPKAAMFLWAQFLQLISCSKKFFSCEQSEDGETNRRDVFLEPPRAGFLRLCCKDFNEERSRAVAVKKIKNQDTKRSLKRAHGALIQRYHHNTNRKRAMDSMRFQRGGGRRGC